MKPARPPIGWRADPRKALAVAHGRGMRARAARRVVAKKLRASPAAEAAYVRDLVSLFRDVQRSTLAAVEPLLEAPELRHDAPAAPDRARRVLTATLAYRVAQYARKKTGEAFDRMAAQVAKRGRAALESVGILKKVRGARAAASRGIGFTAEEAGIGGLLVVARERNISLVDRALRAYADDVRVVFSDPETFGLRVEALRDLLFERGRVSLSRAALIGRDQTLKTHAAIGRARMEAAGVTDYRWSTSRDELVRRMHMELEGERFAFDDPPVTNPAGDTNNPGEDYQCRCVPIPVIAELEEPVEAEIGMAAE